MNNKLYQKIIFIPTDENPQNTNRGGTTVISTDDGKFGRKI